MKDLSGFAFGILVLILQVERHSRIERLSFQGWAVSGFDLFRMEIFIFKQELFQVQKLKEQSITFAALPTSKITDNQGEWNTSCTTPSTYFP